MVLTWGFLLYLGELEHFHINSLKFFTSYIVFILWTDFSVTELKCVIDFKDLCNMF